jgi:hypothetical protein
MNSLSGLIHRAPHTVPIALKLRTPPQIHKTSLLALSTGEAGLCFDLRRTRAAFSLIDAICRMVALNDLCCFSRRRSLAVKQIHFHSVIPTSPKSLGALGGLCVANLAVFESQKILSHMFLILLPDRYSAFTSSRTSDPMQWCLN